MPPSDIEMIHKTSTIRIFSSRESLLEAIEGAEVEGQELNLTDGAAFRACVPALAANVADFGERSAPENVRALAAWMIGEAALQLGVKLNSPHEFYVAIAEGKITREMSFPAINIRSNTLDTARSLFRAAIDNRVGALIIEIARSEMGYTSQAPREYAAVVQAAAILEGFEGPLFLQGDHVQLKSGPVKKGGEVAEKEYQTHRQLIRELMEFGFGSIDLDMSPFERRTEENLTFSEQQADNARLTAEKIADVRRTEKELGTPWVTLLGGETGEVGKMNTREEDLLAYADGISESLAKMEKEEGMRLEGIRKIAVNDGTSHGGVPLPDGTVEDVAIAFDVLEMATRAGKQFGWAGSVQHGASTLPPNAFSLFPKHGAVEVHLATGFQNILMDEGAYQVPGMQPKMEKYLVDSCMSEWKDGQTFAQFAYKTRKKANGPFKYDFWTMPEDIRSKVAKKLYNQFAFLFEQLGVVDTKSLVAEFTTDREFHLPYPTGKGVSRAAGTDDGGDDGDLAD